MRFLLYFILIICPTAFSSTYDLNFGGSMWMTGSAPIKNHYNNLTEESVNFGRKTFKLNSNFISERVIINSSFIYNTQYEKPESLPYAVLRLKLGTLGKFDFFTQAGRSNELTGVSTSTSTPQSRGSGIAPFSYNDNGSSDKWCSSIQSIQYFQGSPEII